MHAYQHLAACSFTFYLTSVLGTTFAIALFLSFFLPVALGRCLCACVGFKSKMKLYTWKTIIYLLLKLNLTEIIATYHPPPPRYCCCWIQEITSGNRQLFLEGVTNPPTIMRLTIWKIFNDFYNEINHGLLYNWLHSAHWPHWIIGRIRFIHTWPECKPFAPYSQFCFVR